MTPEIGEPALRSEMVRTRDPLHAGPEPVAVSDGVGVQMTAFVAILAFIVAAEYVVIAVDVVPRLARIAKIDHQVALAVRWGATAFFVGCAITHTVLGFQTLNPSMDGMEMDPASAGAGVAMLMQMVLPHIAQIIGGGIFIAISRGHLDVQITSKEDAAAARQWDLQIRAALDIAPVGVAFSANANQASYANPAFLEILGFASGRPIPRAEEVLAVMHPADREAGIANMRKVRAGGRADIEFRVVRPDGAVRWIHLRRSAASDVDHPRVTTIVEDITDRVTMNAALAASERRFTQLANSVTVGINLRQLDPPRFLWANTAYAEIVGTDPSQEASTAIDPATVLLHPDDRDRVLTQYWTAAQRGEVVQSEHRVIRPDGEIRWVHATSSPVLDDDGGITRVAGTVEDITSRKTVEEVLADEHRRLRQAESIGRVGSWERNLESGSVSWSVGMFELWGIDPTTFDGDFFATREQIDLDDRPELDAAVDACVNHGVPFQVRYRINRANDGELRWISARGEARYNDNARCVRIGGSVADVTAEVVAEASAAAARAFQQAVFSASPDIISVWDFETQSVTWTNREIAAELGYSGQQILELNGQLVRQLVHPDDQDRFFEATTAARNSPDDAVFHVDYRMLQQDGDHRWFSQQTAPLHRDSAGLVTQIVGVIRDISARKASEIDLRHSALHDNLTGLPNRALLLDRIASSIARAERENTEICVLFCDLDGFKRINDTGGHAAGDAVLVEVSDRLRQSIRKSDSIARVGGDEFVIILEPSRTPSPANPEAGQHTSDVPPEPLTMRQVAELVAGRIRSKLVAPVMYDGQAYSVSTSIGMTFAGRGSSADDVLRDADEAMYLAKHRGRDRFEVFDDALRAEAAQRILVERALRDALAPGVGGKNRLSVAYQPVFDLDDGALIGFEALARLTDTEGNPIPPDVFIPVAENTGLIAPLGAIVLDLALAALSRWHDAHPTAAAATMAVNLSARQAHQSDLETLVLEALVRNGLRPADLILELTESILLDTGSAGMLQLTALHDAGVGIAIDDFGTGYASLRYLTSLPISSLKVDKSFTAGLPDDAISTTIVRAIAALAAELRLTCVIEGIETQGQLSALPPGVLGQGYLLGRPSAELANLEQRIPVQVAGSALPEAEPSWSRI